MRRSEIVIIRYRRTSIVERSPQHSATNRDHSDSAAVSKANQRSKLVKVQGRKTPFLARLISRIFHRLNRFRRFNNN